MSSIVSYVTDSIATILAYFKFIIDLPGLFMTMLYTFPPFFRVGVSFILLILTIALVIKIKSYIV